MPAANTNLSAFLPYVLPKVSGCPEPYALFCLRQSAIEFCEKTKCWRDNMSLALTANNAALTNPTGAMVHEIESAWLDGIKLSPASYADIDPAELTGADESGTPAYIVLPSPGIVSVYPFRAGTLRLSVFLKPRQGQDYGGDPINPLSDALDVVPAFMLQHHAPTLAAGALALILATPGETYTDGNAAASYAQTFDYRVSQQKSAHLRGQQRAPIRTKPNWM